MIDALWHIAPIIIAIALGYFAGFITAAVMAVSSEVSRWKMRSRCEMTAQR